ncbi:uronyl 2-sulfotransferase [Neomonachus schauinslandi]|uniref:Uronyl 2-sulfotransferase n=2 Tax=Monachinae TaxID=3410119 RepID=A0A2Y9HAY5_NEOSC|nr:uronyl 2-sulfotransferase [Neomonachus schauinslandi]
MGIGSNVTPGRNPETRAPRGREEGGERAAESRRGKGEEKKENPCQGGGARGWPHGAPLGGSPPGLGSWKRRVSLLPFLRFSLRDYGFCMATLLVFCLGSLFYQLSGGPPRFLLDLRQYLGNSTYLDDHGPPPSKVLPFPSQVVYNRVGKCGSRTVVLLLRILSEKHGFNLVTSDIHNKTRLTKNEQMELIKNISTAEQPYLFTRHVHFLNFSRFGGDQPVYINIIRDPVNRFLSNYFFRRFGDWRGEQNHMIRTPSMRQEERYLDINECILENYPECSNPRLFYIIPYFCGQHPRCREPGEWALERAKLNVNENFLLVGILEELEDVLLLLERFLPHYFKGVLSIYKDPEHRKLGNMTVTVKKTVPSPEAVQILYQRMRYEYEFYHYVKEQFHLLKRKFGLKSHVSRPPLRPQFFIPTPLETEEPIDDEEQDDEKWLEDIYKRNQQVSLEFFLRSLKLDGSQDIKQVLWNLSSEH